MKQQSTSPNDTKAQTERLARTVYSRRRYNPIFLAVTGVGFIAICLLTQIGILGNPAPRLLYIGIITLMFAIAEIPALAFAQQKDGISATLLGAVMASAFAILLTLLWQGIWPVAILIAAVTPLVAIRSGMPSRYAGILLLVLAASLIGIFVVNATSLVE